MMTKSGKEITMYYPNGQPIKTLNDFIDYYSKCYYIRTSRWVETEIEKILQDDKKTAHDFFNIFAWKTGRINQQESEIRKKFVYTVNKNRKDGAEWYFDPNKGEAIAITRSGVIVKNENGNREPHKLYEYLEYVTRINKNKDASEILKELRGQQEDEEQEVDRISVPKGIGTVYLITFLYFITKGTEPIYDVFAMAALDAIYPDDEKEESKSLGSSIKARNLPDKNTNAYSNLLNNNTNVYRVYRKKLFEYFVNDYLEETGEKIDAREKYAACRNIDRALWFYGHLFEITNNHQEGTLS